MNKVDPAMIASRVRAQVATYVEDYLRVSRPGTLVGTPLSATQLTEEVEALRQALVEPYWLNAGIMKSTSDVEDVRMESCVIVADNSAGHLLAYVPSMDEFTVLREYRPGHYGSFGLDGDAVGAFISI